MPLLKRKRSIAALAAVLVTVLLAAGAPAVASARPGPASGPLVAERDWGTCSAGVPAPARSWYLAEGCTAPGFETWVLVQNPGAVPVSVEMTLNTDRGEIPGPRDTIPARSRRTYDLADYAVSYNVSTVLTASGGVVCERAMYGNGREWGTGAAGVTSTSPVWYLAEGCTAAGFETWVLVQNPGAAPVRVDMSLQTGEGEVDGPRDTIPARSRRSYNLADYAVSYDVSTTVTASAGVVCERAMYGNDREWGTDSTGIVAPSKTWYLAEGCTLPRFETWVLVQNPGDGPAEVRMRLLTDKGEVQGPSGTVPAHARCSYDIGDYSPAASVSTVLTASAPVVAERAMYGDDRLWGTCSSGCSSLSDTWYLAEGCTESGFETWLAVQNPGASPVDVEVTLQTESGEVAGPSGTVEPLARRTFNLGDYVTSYNVSALVRASGAIACERAMYGTGTSRRMSAPVQGPPLYPLTRDESIACGHWPPGSTDYPYFGAPRNGTRLHAGIDIYPPAGPGTPVRALKAGTVVAMGPFYTRYTGEVTYAILVDHGDFVADYAEVQPPESWVQPGAAVSRGQVIGYVSGTAQLHIEMYSPGTTSWEQWYGPQPANLLDPTAMMLGLY
jgi:hypothetical protein